MALAVIVAETVEDTAEFAVAVNVLADDPDETVTDPGTESSPALLESETDKPPLGAAPLRVTVHVVDAGGVIGAGLQLRLLIVACCVGWLIVTVPLLDDVGMESPLPDTPEVADS